MSFSDEILVFWDRVKRETGVEGDFTDAYGIGDSSELKQVFLELILEG